MLTALMSLDWKAILAPATVVAAIVGLIAGVLGALIAGWVSRRNSERTIQIDNVTKERAKWRDTIRAKALQMHRRARSGKSVDELRLEFALNLNPSDEEDSAILQAIENLSECQDGELNLRLTSLSKRVALLLKHDWERAKREAHHPWLTYWKSSTTWKVWTRKFWTSVRQPYEEPMIQESLPNNQQSDGI
jgi:hypothetical protein